MIGTGRSFKRVPRRACLLIRTGANSVRESTKTANFIVLRQYFWASTALLCPVETCTRAHMPLIQICTLLCTLWNHVGTCEARQYLCRVGIGLKSGAPNRYCRQRDCLHCWRFSRQRILTKNDECSFRFNTGRSVYCRRPGRTSLQQRMGTREDGPCLYDEW